MGTYPMIYTENSSNIPNWTQVFSWCGAVTQLAAEPGHLCAPGDHQAPLKRDRVQGSERALRFKLSGRPAAVK